MLAEEAVRTSASTVLWTKNNGKALADAQSGLALQLKDKGKELADAEGRLASLSSSRDVQLVPLPLFRDRRNPFGPLATLDDDCACPGCATAHCAPHVNPVTALREALLHHATAERSDPGAQCRLGIMKQTGELGMPNDVQDALRCLQRAADPVTSAGRACPAQNAQDAGAQDADAHRVTRFCGRHPEGSQAPREGGASASCACSCIPVGASSTAASSPATGTPRCDTAGCCAPGAPRG